MFYKVTFILYYSCVRSNEQSYLRHIEEKSQRGPRLISNKTLIKNWSDEPHMTNIAQSKSVLHEQNSLL